MTTVIEAYISGLEKLGQRRGRPVPGPQRGVVFREPGRHRGRPAAGARAAPATWPTSGARPRWPRPSWPTSCSRSASPVPAGRLWQAKGAHRQRPLWASTSTKNPAYPDLLYVDSLIGPHTVNTMPDATVAAFMDHGTVARTVDQGVDAGPRRPGRLRTRPGIDMADVSRHWKRKEWPSFSKSYDELLQASRTRPTSSEASA